MLHDQKTHPTATLALAHDNLEANLRRGRQLRSEAIRSTFASLFRTLRRPPADRPGATAAPAC